MIDNGDIDGDDNVDIDGDDNDDSDGGDDNDDTFLHPPIYPSIQLTTH